MKDIKSDVNL